VAKLEGGGRNVWIPVFVGSSGRRWFSHIVASPEDIEGLDIFVSVYRR